MEPQDVERRLTTILAADIVGYSRLMGLDEAETLSALTKHRSDLIDPKAAQYGGRIVKLMGDGALMEFASVVDAVAFAVEVQTAMRERNAGVPEDRQIIYRIGINVGDIIVKGDDIYGDGVNVASRLEGLAEPGGICIRRNVRNQVRDKLDLDFEDLGEVEVKNIARPIRVFRVVLDEKAEALCTPVVDVPVKAAPSRLPQIATALAVSLLAIAALVWWQPWAPEFEPASVERMVFPLPDQPSIAVLPFSNMSEDESQDYFADGMTEDLITDLSKISGLFVISRNSSFSYKGRQMKVRQVAEELGVRYVVEGSVRRAGDQVRINAQLIDALSGYHIWADRYDGSLTDVFELQDEVIGQIVAALAINLTSVEAVGKGEAETDLPQAYDALLQGWEHYHRGTPEGLDSAIAHFEKAIELDPGYSRAYAGLATVYWNIAEWGWATYAEIEWQHAVDLANENLAKALEKPTAEAYRISAEILLSHGRHEEAMAAIDRAIALDPNAPDNYVSKAWLQTVTGQPAEAEDNVRFAMRLNPAYRAHYLRILGRALFHQERYEEAAEILQRAASRQPDYEETYVRLAATYGHLGRIEDAKKAIETYNEIVSGAGSSGLVVQFIAGWYQETYHYKNEADLERLLEGLRLAGVPEGVVSGVGETDFKPLVTEFEGAYDVEGATEIDVTTAKKLADRDVVFVDVRSVGYYDEGHIPGAIHLDLKTDLTEANLSEVIGKDDEVVFYCFGESCYLSAHACAKALTWGFTRVYYFPDGFPGWTAAGYPIVTQ
jgi:TolB-like protein/class 3 adenylate cyclase/rhodanese-related sulfurtransferase/Flp pilus assembly protein TadD